MGCGESPKDIWEAAEDGNIEAVKQYLAAGTDVNAKGGETEITPLHVATDRGRKEVVELLIAAGADVNAKDEDGETSLDAAIASIENSPPQVITAKEEIADLLRKHGAKTSEELKAEGK